jgi:hypothetical protein
VAGVNSNQPNNPTTNQPWIDQDIVAVPRAPHPLPKHPDKFLPKFDPKKKDSTENHIKKFMLAVRLMNMEHEDVVCRLFPYTFEGKASTWYLCLTQGSITRWNDFETAFVEKFGDDKSPTILVLELYMIKMEA